MPATAAVSKQNYCSSLFHYTTDFPVNNNCQQLIYRLLVDDDNITS
jgi:hypothetical protein